jgi:hypothetical protein
VAHLHPVPAALLRACETPAMPVLLLHCLCPHRLGNLAQYLDENKRLTVIRDRLQHPSNASSTHDSAPKLARSITVNINQVLQDQRRLEGIQAHNTACNTCLKPH